MLEPLLTVAATAMRHLMAHGNLNLDGHYIHDNNTAQAVDRLSIRLTN